jgi:predicted acylesterase/phospholipase RssA
MLKSFLEDTEFALCISPGFFRYYCYIGILHALHDSNCLRATHIAGSSAGSLVGGFLAAGMSPVEMRDLIVGIKREDMWDMGGFLGLLKGNLFQNLLEKHLPCSAIQQSPIPFGTTAYDVLRCKTRVLQSGSLATAIRASCTFPLLFQPVWIDWFPHIDGGVFDDAGMMALPGVPESSNLIVNIVCGSERAPTSLPPERFKDARVLTLVVDNIPMVTPFSMERMGPVAYSMTYDATMKALLSDTPVKEVAPNRFQYLISGGANRGESTYPSSSHIYLLLQCN